VIENGALTMNRSQQDVRFPTSLAVLVWLTVNAGVTVEAQTEAQSLSGGFRKAAARTRSSIVAVRPSDGILIWSADGRPVTRSRPRFASPWREAVGSGVVIDADRGHVLTLDHILGGSSQAEVVLADGRERFTSQIRRDLQSDLAILLIDSKGLNLTSAQWGDSGALEPGDWVLSIGQPPGSAPALSAGIYSARRLGLGGFPAGTLLETDVAVNNTSAGGPLINMRGEVVGINTLIGGARGLAAGMGFAMPGERARRIAADLIEFGTVRRAYLGMHIEPADRAAAERAGAALAVTISNVAPGSPAAEAGLRAGDLIVSIDGQPVGGVEMLQAFVELAPVGEEITLGIERDGRRQDVRVRPQGMPSPPGIMPGAAGTPDARRDALRANPRTRPESVSPKKAPQPSNPTDLEPAPPNPPQPAPAPKRQNPEKSSEPTRPADRPQSGSAQP
jgi:S1-C subfamily serine protease